MASISPSESWTGTAASGFVTTPSDPTRTSAKPAMRLLVPPNQFYTDELLVGLTAWANDGGSMLVNCGLEKVVVHYEGNSVNIAAPSFETFDDANGNPVTYFGWWVRLKHDGRNGHAQAYFEGVARDAEMQHRVIGPFQFSPQPAIYDASVTVSKAGGGGTYTSIRAAATALISTGAQNPLVTVIQAGDYDESYQTVGAAGGGTTTRSGYLNVTAIVPGVRIVGNAARNLNSLQNAIRYRWDGIRFFGSNLEIDAEHLSEIWNENSGRQNWLDGITVSNSAGLGDLWLGAPRPVSWFQRNGGYFTECVISDINDPIRASSIARGCTVRDCYDDIASSSRCVVDNTFENMSSEDYWEEIPAISVQYTGGGASATLEMSGGNGASSRTLNAKVDGVSVGTLTTQTSSTANPNYWPADVAAWLDGLAGWTATLLDNSRRAAYMSKPLNRGASFAATDVKASPLTLVSTIDLHSDFYAVDTLNENVVVSGNRGWGLYTQGVFLYNPGGMRDTFFVNNALHNLVSANPDHAAQSSQLGYVQSHVVMAHNSLATTDVLLRQDTGYNPDGYCLLANNTIAGLPWSGTEDADLRVDSNHLQAGSAAAINATHTTDGGDGSTLFADAAAGDFSPAGALLANLKVPVVKYDLAGNARGALAAAGARASS